MPKKKEIWKDIIGWEGIYQISNHGRLKSFKRIYTGYILSLKNKTGWYLSTVLEAKNKKSFSIKIHSLVGLYFVDNPMNKPQINHKDLDKQNNYFENLEWATCHENMKHAATINPSFLRGMKYRNQILNPKKVFQYDMNRNFIFMFNNCKEAADGTGVCQRNIHQVAARTEYKPGLTRKQAGGFIWGFENDHN